MREIKRLLVEASAAALQAEAVFGSGDDPVPPGRRATQDRWLLEG